MLGVVLWRPISRLNVWGLRLGNWALSESAVDDNSNSNSISNSNTFNIEDKELYFSTKIWVSVLYILY